MKPFQNNQYNNQIKQFKTNTMKTINKKNYKEFLEMTASELRVVARMAERMAQDAEALETPTQENYEHLQSMDVCMRAAFHAMHKGYIYITKPYAKVVRNNGEHKVREALNNIGITIENIESN